MTSPTSSQINQSPAADKAVSQTASVIPTDAVTLKALIADSGPLPLDATVECYQQLTKCLSNNLFRITFPITSQHVWIDDDGEISLDSRLISTTRQPPMANAHNQLLNDLFGILSDLTCGSESHGHAHRVDSEISFEDSVARLIESLDEPDTVSSQCRDAIINDTTKLCDLIRGRVLCEVGGATSSSEILPPNAEPMQNASSEPQQLARPVELPHTTPDADEESREEPLTSNPQIIPEVRPISSEVIRDTCESTPINDGQPERQTSLGLTNDKPEIKAPPTASQIEHETERNAHADRSKTNTCPPRENTVSSEELTPRTTAGNPTKWYLLAVIAALLIITLFGLFR